MHLGHRMPLRLVKHRTAMACRLMDMLQLLQRTYPGQLPTVRRDIHNVIIPLDLTDLKDIELLVESLQTFVKRKVPIRWGIVPQVTSASGVDQAKVVYHLLDAYGLSGVLAYLEAVCCHLGAWHINYGHPLT